MNTTSSDKKSFSPLEPPKRWLFGAGPAMVEEAVYVDLAKPIVGHLDPYFLQVTEDISELLRLVFGTSNEFTMAISGTGSAGMEAAVGNFVEPGSKFAVFANGYFADRLSEMGRRQGAEVVRLEKPWGQTFTEEGADSFLAREKPSVVAFVHAETSTGALQDPRIICEAARRVGALVIADCVTSLGGIPVNIDANGIDVAYSCSQKCLGCPPGLSPITVSPRALERLRARTTLMPHWYLDLKLLADYYGTARRYHHTVPISMFYGLRRALLLIKEEGLEARFARHRKSHAKLVERLEAFGFQMLVAPEHRAPTINTPLVPAGLDDVKVRRRLLEENGIEILSGLGQLAGRVFRIGLMGVLATEQSVNFLMDNFERACRAEGY